MKVLLSNLPWYKEPEGEIPGWRGVRAGSRWPHTFEYFTHNVVDGIIPDLTVGYAPFPFWLATAGALLKKHGFDAYTRDSITLGETYDNFLQFANDYNPDVFVVETATATLDNDLALIKELKTRFPKLIVVLTGLHFEIDKPEFLEQHSDLDYLIYGEYEPPLLELLQAIKNQETDLSSISNLVYKEGTDYTKTEKGTLIDLDDLPWPERGDGLPALNYFDSVGGLPHPQFQLIASRGCPYGCIFCVWPQMFMRSHKYRIRSPEDIVDEIEENFKKQPYQSFYIDDDTVNINRKHVIKLANLIKERGLNKYRWGTMGRADLMDDEQLVALKEAGLFSIKYGVESADQTILDDINKRIELERVIDGIKRTKEMGINVHLTFTFGLPNDTRETIERTIALACELPCDSAQFSIATPYPGTSMYTMYKEKGWITSEKWSDYVGSTTAVSGTKNLSAEELENFIKDASRRFDETQILRDLVMNSFPEHLKERMNDEFTGKSTIIVLQSARISFTQYLLRLLEKWRYDVHVLTHKRFIGDFESILPDNKIHSFSSSGSFIYEPLKSLAEELNQQYGFDGAIVPYSNLSGGGYTDVEKIAEKVGSKISMGINIQGEFIK
ncbi:MAG: radical SAM protein [Gammaproteobacteria bacterium]|nr:radical SAM protein [Gammaproteobacteria bacterium]